MITNYKMAKELFTKETAGMEHKRGGKIELSDREWKTAYLKLCETMTSRKR